MELRSSADLSRRNLVKGAAWAVPTVALASVMGATAAQATATGTVAGQTGDFITVSGGTTMCTFAGTTASTTSGPGTALSMVLGQWTFVNPLPGYITGYQLDFAKIGHQVYVNDGNVYAGTFPVEPTSQQPQVIGAGLDVVAHLQTNRPYASGFCGGGTPAKVINKVKIAVAITYLHNAAAVQVPGISLDTAYYFVTEWKNQGLANCPTTCYDQTNYYLEKISKASIASW